MKEKNNLYNQRTLALLGVLDITRKLYLDMQQAAASEMECLMEEKCVKGHNPMIWDSQVNKKSYPKYKKMLNTYFSNKQIVDIFSAEDRSRLYLNDKILNYFDFVDYKKGKDIFRFEYSTISFAKFLEHLQFFANKVLYHHNTDSTFEMVCEQTNERIKKLTEKAIQKIKNAMECNNEVPAEIIWVFDNLSGIKCYSQKHNISPATLTVPLLDSPNDISIPVHYCSECQRFFIGRLTLDVFQNEFGLLLIHKKQMSDGEEKLDWVQNLEAESELHSLGYNVVDGKMSDYTRQKLLANLITRKIITKDAICKTLEYCIRLFNGREQFDNAIAKWKADLKYISEFDMPTTQGRGVLRQSK